MSTPFSQSEPIDLKNLLSSRKVGVSYLISWSWWQNKFGQIGKTLYLFWAPAFLLTIANIVILACLYVMEQNMSNMTESINSVIVSVLASMILAWLAIVISFWALTVWLYRLTALARCLILNDSLNVSDLNNALAYLSNKKAYFAKLWLIASIYIMVPGLPLIFITVFWAFSQPALLKMTGMEMFGIPYWLTCLLQIFIGILSLLCTAYTLVTIAISSVSQDGAGETATMAMKVCITKYSAVLAVAVFVCFINLVLSSPHVFLLFSKYSSLALNSSFINLIATIWLGLTSIILWPISMVPFCQLIKSYLFHE